MVRRQVCFEIRAPALGQSFGAMVQEAAAHLRPSNEVIGFRIEDCIAVPLIGHGGAVQAWRPSPDALRGHRQLRQCIAEKLEVLFQGDP